MSDFAKNPGNKQIIYFFVGFLIFFAFSFSLGVMVGKNIDVDTGTGGKITEDGREMSPFQETETTDGYGINTGEQPFPNENEKASALASKRDEVKTVESTPQPSRSSSMQIDDKNFAQPAVNKDATSLDTERQKISDIEEVSNKRNAIKSLPPIDPEGKYTVQVGSFQEEKAAVQFLNSLKLKRYPASVKRVVIPGYGASYRVRIGTFATRDKANLYGENLKKIEPYIKSVYITMNN